MAQERPFPLPDGFVDEVTPNEISIFRDCFNNVPNLDLVDDDGFFEFGFELGPDIEIYDSISNLSSVDYIDFSGMDINVIN